jgi:peptidoglycan/xylan/chitin deacetylase (PgdA/CDA1 family)
MNRVDRRPTAVPRRASRPLGARRSRTATRIVSLAIATAYWAARGVYGAVRRLFGAPGTTPLVVLTYHAVSAQDAPRFERQMLALKRSATPVFADEPLARPGRRVAVTFDDAFQCVFDYALPVLARHDVPATVFVPTGFLGARPGWMVTRGRGDDVPDRVVTRARLERLDARRVRLGSHSVTHPRLAQVDARALGAEMSASRRTLEDLTRTPVRTFALPYGSCSPTVLGAAAAAGYRRVYANVPVRYGRGAEPLLVGRIDVSPRDWPLEFRLKSEGAYQWLTLAIPAKRSLLRLLGRSRPS